MAYYRECQICGCTLDPGEGNVCDDCVAEMELRAERRKTLFGALEEAAGGQMIIGGLKNAR